MCQCQCLHIVHHTTPAEVIARIETTSQHNHLNDAHRDRAVHCVVNNRVEVHV